MWVWGYRYGRVVGSRYKSEDSIEPIGNVQVSMVGRVDR